MNWNVDDEAIEIESIHDWWVTEKLLKKKRIVFRVIGGDNVGMGHIYRALSLAHGIQDHEVLFVSDTESEPAVVQLAGYDYWLGIYESSEIISRIIELEPDVVVNDILNTKAEDVIRIRDKGISVVNFEDLGSGATVANLTINELYDKPILKGSNCRWGHEFFFVREEFESAKPIRFNNEVSRILLTFGGTDQHNLSRVIYDTIVDICRRHDVYIHIVTGPGYKEYNNLKNSLFQKTGVEITHATGVISSIMETVQLAITSNGRTVYELAHMNIPTIVIPQHERERTHSFASEKNGFILMDPYIQSVTEENIGNLLETLITDSEYRYSLYRKMLKYSFIENKQRVLTEILQFC